MQREQQAMGGAVTVQLWADDRSQGAAAMAAVVAEMQRIERTLHPRRADSELAIANAAAAERSVVVGEEVFGLLSRAQALARLTHGAFDACCGGLLALYDAAGSAPDELALARAVQAGGWRQVKLDPAASSVRYLRPGLRLELGGLLRGYAVDRSVALLQRQGIRHAIVSAGSDSRLLGDRRGQPWTVALREPGQPGQADAALALLPLQDSALSTAARSPAGRRPGVLDPRSGRPPAAGLRSASVVAPNGLSASALAKALLVLGAERALALVQGLTDIDAVLVDDEGRLLCSRGLQALQPPPLLRPAVSQWKEQA